MAAQMRGSVAGRIAVVVTVVLVTAVTMTVMIVNRVQVRIAMARKK
jgi:hypothetical protein